MGRKTITSDMMYRLLVQNIQDYAIYCIDPDGIVLNWNSGAERLKGYTAEEIIGQSYDVFHGDEARAMGVPRHNLELARSEGHMTTEGWRFRKDGTSFYAAIALTPIVSEDGEFFGYAKITQDLTEQRAAQHNLIHQATHDHVTGLLNRVGLKNRLEPELAALEHGEELAIHCIDLDRFKSVNDTFGHAAGDEVLCSIAKRLRQIAGHSAYVARTGGDEFTLVQLGSPSQSEVEAMANLLIDALNHPVPIDDVTTNIGGSVGVAIAPGDSRDCETLIRNGVLALYRSKREGRNAVRFYDRSADEGTLSRSFLELKLRNAVKRCEFHLNYQPVVDVENGTIIGYEALLRWVDPTGKTISPAEFIPVAEELGLMPVIGEWVLRTACRDAAQWPDELTLAVNVSTRQLRETNFVELVASVLNETKLPGRRLELEITETAILLEPLVVRERLERLRQLDIGVALDDFGTGYSSLSLVRELPMTRVKIDRCFVSTLEEDAASSAIVKAIIALGKACNLEITAEGVETRAQSEILRKCGCSHHQGYLYGRPQSKILDQCMQIPERRG